MVNVEKIIDKYKDKWENKGVLDWYGLSREMKLLVFKLQNIIDELRFHQKERYQK